MSNYKRLHPTTLKNISGHHRVLHSGIFYFAKNTLIIILAVYALVLAFTFYGLSNVHQSYQKIVQESAAFPREEIVSIASQANELEEIIDENSSSLYYDVKVLTNEGKELTILVTKDDLYRLIAERRLNPKLKLSLLGANTFKPEHGLIYSYDHSYRLKNALIQTNKVSLLQPLILHSLEDAYWVTHDFFYDLPLDLLLLIISSILVLVYRIFLYPLYLARQRKAYIELYLEENSIHKLPKITIAPLSFWKRLFNVRLWRYYYLGVPWVIIEGKKNLRGQYILWNGAAKGQIEGYFHQEPISPLSPNPKKEKLTYFVPE